MTISITREQATAAVAAAVAERDTIQANLLDLDGSFGKRLLTGAKLAGESQQRWATADADMTALWETFNAYSAVVDRIADLGGGAARATAARLADLAALLYGPSVRLATTTTPVGRRELTATANNYVTIAVAVAAMKQVYASVAAVCDAAEAIWNQVADGLSRASTSLEHAQQQAAGLADADLASTLAVAQANLAQLRETVNTDPLALGPAGAAGNAGAAALARLQQQVDAVASRASELGRLRADADQRIAAVSAVVRAATDAWQDASAARQRAAAKIEARTPQPLADPGELQRRLADLPELRGAGRWTRLDGELRALDKDAAAAVRQYRDAEQAAAAELDRRDEMRGLLDAYKAKAAQLGAAEDLQLAGLYEQARDALWTAPCDLAAADAAVRSYQQAVLALSAAGGRR
ncbi:MAG TPA: hypothetical protein VLM11_20400 [Streptosporangiaceae bacterium]|nr:hypothetical protein [Streptosporangiaceae bacterium]